MLKGHKKVIEVSDRESDIYFYIKEIKKRGQGYVIRGCRNRATEEGYLMETIKEVEYKGEKKIEIKRKGGRKRREARVKIYSRGVEIKPPRVINHKGETIKVNLVYVKEEGEEEEKIEWILLTSEGVDSIEECERIIWYYGNRWQIEDFNKGLKTGCAIEERQLETREEHEKLLSVFSIIAWHGLLLRYNAREGRDKEIAMDEIQIEILKEEFPELKEKVDAQSILRAVARLGGFIGRKSDGNPGWLTIFRGLIKLKYIKQGFLLAKRMRCG